MAKMYAEAENEQAVLLLDEADSFLRSRRMAERNYEVSEVNEMLQGMERFAGIFICTTNLFEELDEAALRRFTFKIRFHPLKPEQRERMFVAEALAGDAGSLSDEQRAPLDRTRPTHARRFRGGEAAGRHPRQRARARRISRAPRGRASREARGAAAPQHRFHALSATCATPRARRAGDMAHACYERASQDPLDRCRSSGMPRIVLSFHSSAWAARAMLLLDFARHPDAHRGWRVRHESGSHRIHLRRCHRTAVLRPGGRRGIAVVGRVLRASGCAAHRRLRPRCAPKLARLGDDRWRCRPVDCVVVWRDSGGGSFRAGGTAVACRAAAAGRGRDRRCIVAVHPGWAALAHGARRDRHGGGAVLHGGVARAGLEHADATRVACVARRCRAARPGLTAAAACALAPRSASDDDTPHRADGRCAGGRGRVAVRGACPMEFVRGRVIPRSTRHRAAVRVDRNVDDRFGAQRRAARATIARKTAALEHQAAACERQSRAHALLGPVDRVAEPFGHRRHAAHRGDACRNDGQPRCAVVHRPGCFQARQRYLHAGLRRQHTARRRATPHGAGGGADDSATDRRANPRSSRHRGIRADARRSGRPLGAVAYGEPVARSVERPARLRSTRADAGRVDRRRVFSR